MENGISKPFEDEGPISNGGLERKLSVLLPEGGNVGKRDKESMDLKPSFRFLSGGSRLFVASLDGVQSLVSSACFFLSSSSVNISISLSFSLSFSRLSLSRPLTLLLRSLTLFLETSVRGTRLRSSASHTVEKAP